jgi:hypothetical protein
MLEQAVALFGKALPVRVVVHIGASFEGQGLCLVKAAAVDDQDLVCEMCASDALNDPIFFIQRQDANAKTGPVGGSGHGRGWG